VYFATQVQYIQRENIPVYEHRTSTIWRTGGKTQVFLNSAVDAEQSTSCHWYPLLYESPQNIKRKFRESMVLRIYEAQTKREEGRQGRRKYITKCKFGVLTLEIHSGTKFISQR
jgi:formyltetrahydrofolate synthetase